MHELLHVILVNRLGIQRTLIYVLLGAAVLAAAIGHITDAAVILAVVILNAIIGFVQEGRAEQALEAIRKTGDREWEARILNNLGYAYQQAGKVEDARRAYQAALDQFKLGNYPLAVSAMQGFLVTYPRSSLAPNAQYWIGMAYSGQRDYKSAIAAQRKVLASYPDSEKAPDAMLSIASSQETMGDRKSAQQTLQELISRYPQSSAAASAKQRIAAFGKR